MCACACVCVCVCVCVCFMTGASEGSTELVLDKPGIGPATPVLQGISFIHYTTAAYAEIQLRYNIIQVRKRAKIRNRHNQVHHLTQDTHGKVTNSQLDTTNESQEVSPFPAGDHKTTIHRRAQK